MIRAIIVEDSELAQIELENLLGKNQTIELVGKASNGMEAIKLINAENPDLIFLDIHLPDMNGFELLNEIRQSPKVIFTTAYDEYAVKSFDYVIVRSVFKDALKQVGISTLVLPCFSKS